MDSLRLVSHQRFDSDIIFFLYPRRTLKQVRNSLQRKRKSRRCEIPRPPDRKWDNEDGIRTLGRVTSIQHGDPSSDYSTRIFIPSGQELEVRCPEEKFDLMSTPNIRSFAWLFLYLDKSSHHGLEIVSCNQVRLDQTTFGFTVVRFARAIALDRPPILDEF